MRLRKMTLFRGVFLVSTLTGSTICGETRTHCERAGGKEYVNRNQIEKQVRI